MAFSSSSALKCESYCCCKSASLPPTVTVLVSVRPGISALDSAAVMEREISPVVVGESASSVMRLGDES